MKLEERKIIEAANRLGQARLDAAAMQELPAECRPGTEAEAYDLQDAVHGRLEKAGYGVLEGWKVGCTTPVMQAYMKIHSPCAGGLFAATVHRSPAVLECRSYVRPGIECEIAVRLGRDLPINEAPFDRAAVAAVVEACYPAVELVDARFPDWSSVSTPTLIADDFFGAGCVLGPECRDWQTHDLATLKGAMTVAGEVAGEGVGADVLGHPFEALAWLANALAARGKALRRGELVLTGSLVKTVWIDEAAEVVAAIEGLGEVRLAFE